jgi:hypothetical protein
MMYCAGIDVSLKEQRVRGRRVGHVGPRGQCWQRA